MKPRRVLISLLVAMTLPRIGWLLVSGVVLFVFVEATYVLLSGMPAASTASVWLSLAYTSGSIAAGYLMVLLGSAWRRVRTTPVLALAPDARHALAGLMLLGVTVATLLTFPVTILAVTDSSWRWWRSDEMAHAFLSPHYVPWSEYLSVGLTIALWLVACFVGAARGVARAFLITVAVSVPLADRGWYWMPIAIVIVGDVWRRFGALSRIGVKWLARDRPAGRRDALRAMMRRRQQPVLSLLVATFCIAMATFNEGQSIATFALSANYALLAMNPIELRQVWLIPGSGTRNWLGDALLRRWTTDCACVILFAVTGVLLVTAAYTYLTTRSSTFWLMDANVQHALMAKARFTLLSAIAMLGTVWSGLRVMTCSPRLLTSGPALLGAGQWIPLLVSLAVGVAQWTLAFGRWPDIDHDWFRGVEGSAILSGVIAPAVAWCLAWVNRRAWENANIADVAQMLNEMARKQARGFLADASGFERRYR